MLVILFGAAVLRVESFLVFLLFGVVVFVIVRVCGREDMYFRHCGPLAQLQHLNFAL